MNHNHTQHAAPDSFGAFLCPEETRMSPAHVPNSAIEAAFDALGHEPVSRDEIHAALTAALPHIEAHYLENPLVREVRLLRHEQHTANLIAWHGVIDSEDPIIEDLYTEISERLWAENGVPDAVRTK